MNWAKRPASEQVRMVVQKGVAGDTGRAERQILSSSTRVRGVCITRRRRLRGGVVCITRGAIAWSPHVRAVRRPKGLLGVQVCFARVLGDDL